MTREGAVEVNAATGKKKRISKRIRDADFVKTEAPQQPEQAAQTIPGGAASAPTADAPPLPHATGAEREIEMDLTFQPTALPYQQLVQLIN